MGGQDASGGTPDCCVLVPFQALLVQPLEQEAEFSTLPVLPEVVREVAEQGLKEEDEDDPLVPSVSDLVALRGHLDQVPVC